jgi:hypothetical protein
MSTTATGLPPNVEGYLAALRAELSDLAPEERDDLLAEVEPSLLEAAADGDEPIAGRLGAPADFAADLRASAGLPPAPPRARPSGLLVRIRELASAPATAARAAPHATSRRSGGRRARTSPSACWRSCSASTGRYSTRRCRASAASAAPRSCWRWRWRGRSRSGCGRGTRPAGGAPR